MRVQGPPALDRVKFHLLVACLFVSLGNLFAQVDHQLRLKLAVEQLNAGLSDEFLRLGASALRRDRSGRTALHWLARKKCYRSHFTCAYQSVDVAEVLFKYAINPNALDKDGKTALYYALNSRNIKLVEFLVSKKVKTIGIEKVLFKLVNDQNLSLVRELTQLGLNFETSLKSGKSLLMEAFHLKQFEMAKWLLERGADPMRRDRQGKTVAMWAVEHGGLESLTLLGESIDFQATDNQGKTLLHYAGINNRCQAIQHLIQSGVRQLATDHLGNTFFHYFVSKQKIGSLSTRKECLKNLSINTELLDKLNFNRESALWVAAAMDESIFKLLISKGAQVQGVNLNGVSILARAAKANRFSNILGLLESGHQIEEESHRKENPLFYAIQNQNQEMAQLLIEKGVNTKWKTKRSQENFIHLAVIYQLPDLIAPLVAKGVKINEGDKDGITPLMISKTIKMSKNLIALGADLNQLDREERGAIDFANLRNNKELASFLRQRADDQRLPASVRFSSP